METEYDKIPCDCCKQAHGQWLIMAWAKDQIRMCEPCWQCVKAFVEASTKPPSSTALASQVGGSHYKDMAIQPVEYIHRNGIGYCAGSAIKYLSRHEAKGKAEDIRKAIHFCQLILEMQYGEK